MSEMTLIHRAASVDLVPQINEALWGLNAAGMLVAFIALVALVGWFLVRVVRLVIKSRDVPQ